MGIVNAFINQIGREAARDVYRGTRSRAKLPTPEETFIPFNDSFLAEVKNFQILFIIYKIEKICRNL